MSTAPTMSKRRRKSIETIYSSRKNPPVSLNGTGVPFAGADAYDLLEIEDENLSVADLAGLRRFGDSLDHLLEQRIVDRDFYFCLGHEFHDVFGAPINLRMTALPAEAADLGHRDALHAYFADGLPDIVELEWFDDRGDELHRLCSSPIRMLTVVGKHRLCHLQRIERDQRLSILRAGSRIVSALNRGMDDESMPCNEASPAASRTAQVPFHFNDISNRTLPSWLFALSLTTKNTRAGSI